MDLPKEPKPDLNEEHPTSGTVMTRKELNRRLKEARARNRKLKAEGKTLPNPMKEWSRDSLESLTAALSGKS